MIMKKQTLKKTNSLHDKMIHIIEKIRVKVATFYKNLLRTKRSHMDHLRHLQM